MSGLTGDFAELDAAIAQLEQLDDATERVAAAAAPALAAVAQAQWKAGRGPDGARWPPDKRGGGVPLAALTSRVAFTSAGSTIVATGPDELAFHQRGTAHFPPRPVFPDEGGDLPPTWRAPLEAATRAEIDGGGPR